MANIYWRDVKSKDKIVLKGNQGSQYFEVNGKTIYWFTQESATAPKKLMNQIIKNSRKKRRGN